MSYCEINLLYVLYELYWSIGDTLFYVHFCGRRVVVLSIIPWQVVLFLFGVCFIYPSSLLACCYTKCHTHKRIGSTCMWDYEVNYFNMIIVFHSKVLTRRRGGLYVSIYDRCALISIRKKVGERNGFVESGYVSARLLY